MHWFWFYVTANEFFETDRFFLSVSPSPPTLLIKLSIASWLHANQLKTTAVRACLADQKVPCMMSRHQPSAFQVMPPSLSVGDTDELKRKSAHQLMQLSQLLMARDQELEELNEMVSLLKSQMDISAEDAKEALKAIEAHVRATEGKLQAAASGTGD